MPDLAMLDYFYGDEAEQFTFYRIPKVLFTDPSYRRISSDAKILYGLMLDRMGLSVRNGWLDEYNRVFIFFTLEDALEYLCCGHLLFYHRELQCLVAIDLKIDDFKPEYLGKMEFYLEALDRDIRKPHENPSVGIILCKSKDEDVVEYALSRNMSSTMISEYRTKLISKEILQKKLEELYDAADESQNSQQC